MNTSLHRHLKKSVLVVSHAVAVLVGAGAGIYYLPIAIAAHSPASADDIALEALKASYRGEFIRSLKGSDTLHWGDGQVFIGEHAVSFSGELSPGPDYKLYLSPEFVETDADFERLKGRMVRVGDIRTFKGFLVPLPATIDPEAYDTVIVWCETFHKFITSARYR